jgi:hypothetical protein
MQQNLAMVPSNHYVQAAEQLAAVLENPATDAELVEEIKEKLDTWCTNTTSSLNFSHPLVLRKLYPVLRELRTEHPMFFHNLSE